MISKNKTKNKTKNTTVLFDSGTVVITPGASCMLVRNNAHVEEFLARHFAGDWGDCCKEDSKMNDDAVEFGGRVLSSYKVRDEKLWIITDGVGKTQSYATTVLLPEEY